MKNLNQEQIKNLTKYLKNYISENKIAKAEEVLNKRTNHFTIVLENLQDQHNNTACIRNCDCFGIQNIHIIQHLKTFKIKYGYAPGAIGWVEKNIYDRHNKRTNQDCFEKLKQEGYKLICLSPHEEANTIYNFPLEEKAAFVFGSEKDGLSEVAMKAADSFMTIPMFGFTESLNVSVSLGILLSQIMPKLYQSNIDWQLSPKEKELVRFKWYKNMLRKSSYYVNRFLKENNP